MYKINANKWRVMLILNTSNYFPSAYAPLYMHNWWLQTFSQDCGLASRVNYVAGVNFTHDWRDLQLKVDFEQTSSRQFYLFSEFLLEEIFFHISFCGRYLVLAYF